MGCGTPVVASNTTSLPEVAGEAGLLVDPTDVAALADAMHRLVAEPGLSQALREAGLVQATRFSWKRTAELLLGQLS